MAQSTDGPQGLVERSRGYVTEVREEFEKITWPPQPEVINGTIAVLVIVGVMATFLGVVDFGLSWVMRMVLG